MSEEKEEYKTEQTNGQSKLSDLLPCRVCGGKMRHDSDEANTHTFCCLDCVDDDYEIRMVLTNNEEAIELYNRIAR